MRRYEDQLDEPDGLSGSKIYVLKGLIEQRDVDYEHFLRTDGEVLAQANDPVRHAFKQGWQIGRESR